MLRESLLNALPRLRLSSLSCSHRTWPTDPWTVVTTAVCARRSQLRANTSVCTTSTKPAPASGALQDKPFYVTTPIFYVNAAPHVGHLYSMVLADIIKRWELLKGEKAILCTGTDEHGMKVSFPHATLMWISIKSLIPATGPASCCRRQNCPGNFCRKRRRSIQGRKSTSQLRSCC